MQRMSNVANRRIAIHAGRDVDIYPVLGFPKSGTTWLCQMLADALALPFARLPLLPVAMPCVLHGHWSYHPKLPNVTFAIRDGRDVMVSFYYHHRLMHEAGRRSSFFATSGAALEKSDIRSNMPSFINHVFDRPVGASLNWTEYNESWLDRPNAVFVRYEHLLENPELEIRRLCHDLGRPAEDWRIRRAVEGWSMSRLTGRSPGEEDNASFVRKGIRGEWTNVFCNESRKVFSERAGAMLVRLGYESDADWRCWSDPCSDGPGQ
jgi:hypothetical protein